jgi:hypothetical protein
LAALSWGSTSAMTSSMPTAAATRFAVAWLSPVSMTARTPISRRTVTAAFALSRGASAIAMIAAAVPSSATCTVVLPCPANVAPRSARPSRVMCSRSSSRALPTASRWPSTVASAHRGARVTTGAADRQRTYLPGSPRGWRKWGRGFTRTRRVLSVAKTATVVRSTSTPRSPSSDSPSDHGRREKKKACTSRRSCQR